MLLLLCYIAINAAAIAAVLQTAEAVEVMSAEKSATTASDESWQVYGAPADVIERNSRIMRKGFEGTTREVAT